MESSTIPGLSVKEARFVRAFLVNGFNASQAYKSAGYQAKTVNSVSANSSRLLAKDKIQTAIKQEMWKEETKLEEEYSITKDSLRREMAIIGFSSLKNLAEWGPNGVKMKDSDAISDTHAKAMKTIKYSSSESATDTGQSASQSLSIGMHDKVKALEVLMRSTGVLNGANDDDSEDPGSRESVEEEVSDAIEAMQR